MLTYRGDKFVKGKKFKINETEYRFQKRDDDDNLIFESVEGTSKLKLTEEEFNNKDKQILDPTNYINNVAKEFRVYFDVKVPFEDFYAQDSEDFIEGVSYDYADFYDKILHDMGYGENPVLNDCNAVVSEVSDGKNEMTLEYNGKTVTLDLDAWDNFDNVKDNVETIVNLLSSK